MARSSFLVLLVGAVGACAPVHVRETAPANASALPTSPSLVAVPFPTAESEKSLPRMTVHFYDVGQALAVLVELPDGRHLLIDAGDSPGRPECGATCAEKHRHLLTQLRADLHGASLDVLWITHQHSDHIGGAPEVLASFHVRAYVDNGRDGEKGEVARARRSAEAHGVALHVVDPAHLALPIPPAPDLILTPVVPPAWPASCHHDANECSIGLRIDFRASSVLFVGDAEREEETALDPGGPVTLLQVAHHGSETSSSPRFLAKTTPRYAVVSAGAPGEGLNQDYCHPRALVVERLTRALGGGDRAHDGGKRLLAFEGGRCEEARPSSWVSVAASDRLWATERDGDVVLTTTGDGTFTRVP